MVDIAKLVNGVFKPINITTGPHSVETYRYIWINYENGTNFFLQRTKFPFLRNPIFFKAFFEVSQPPNQPPQGTPRRPWEHSLRTAPLRTPDSSLGTDVLPSTKKGVEKLWTKMAIYLRKQVIYFRKKKTGDLPQKNGIWQKKYMGFNEFSGFICQLRRGGKP